MDYTNQGNDDTLFAADDLMRPIARSLNFAYALFHCLIVQRQQAFSLRLSPLRTCFNKAATKFLMAENQDTTANITDDRGPLKDDGTEDQTVLPWKSKIDISIAKSRKIRGGNYVQIATVDIMGLPHCRTVVFRGFMDLPLSSSTSQSTQPPKLAMKMITDARSEKASQIKDSPACEMVYWFGKSSEQYRITGKLMLVSEEDDDVELLQARKQQWGNLSDMAREQFFWQSPGVPYSQASSIEHTIPVGGRSDVDGKVLEPPPSFLVMLLVPEKVKYLRLTDNFAQIDTISETGEWISSRVNP